MSETRYKALEVRLYPTRPQQIQINKTLGCCRLLWNQKLNERNEYYENVVSKIDKEDKKARAQAYKEFEPKDWSEEYEFFSEVSSQALCQTANDLNTAYKNFFKHGAGAPKFKAKRDKQAYRECMPSKTALNWFSKSVKIPKLKTVAFSRNTLPVWFKDIIKLKSITVKKARSGKYYAVLLYEVKTNNKVKKQTSEPRVIGLDFSPSKMYVDSNGKTGVDYGYKPFKQVSKKKLKREQRRLARKEKDSKNRAKAKTKVARCEEKIANQRADWQNKEVLRLVQEYDVIIIEDLNLKGISKFLKNAKNMNDTAWGTFTLKLASKAVEYDCMLVKADKYFPSSKLCSDCGYKNKKLKLSDRSWVCPVCGCIHDRDVNAAVNLSNYLDIPQELWKSRPVKGIEGCSVKDLSIQLECAVEAGRVPREQAQKMPCL